MHISHKASAISAPLVIQKYIFNHIAATAGWFIDEGGNTLPFTFLLMTKNRINLKKQAKINLDIIYQKRS